MPSKCWTLGARCPAFDLHDLLPAATLSAPAPIRIALVHEWLTTFGGSELVLSELVRLFPHAELFVLIDRMSPADRRLLALPESHVTLLDRLPGVRRYYRSLLPLFPLAVRSHDLRHFDLVISNSHAVAKGVRTRPGQLHLSYCISPMRYAWDLRDQYLEEAGLSRGIRGASARWILERLRRWDASTHEGVDAFSTLSHFVADRIRRAYGREAQVIYPPIDTGFFTPEPLTLREDYYFTASRFVPYKRVDLIAAAFAQLPGRRLVIAGEGPDLEKVRAACGPSVQLIGHCSRQELRDHLRRARAFLFAAEEDFGIAPLEAQACGTPVIAYGRGGATETVVAEGPRRTGLFFPAQSPESLARAIERFEVLDPPIRPEDCRANAERFSAERFRSEFLQWVREQAGSRGWQLPHA